MEPTAKDIYDKMISDMMSDIGTIDYSCRIDNPECEACQ